MTRKSDALITNCQVGDFIGAIFLDDSFRLMRVEHVGKHGPITAKISATAKQLICEIELKARVFAITDRLPAVERLWKIDKRTFASFWAFSLAVGRIHKKLEAKGRARMADSAFQDLPAADVGETPQNAPAPRPALDYDALTAHLKATSLDADDLDMIARYETARLMGDEQEAAWKAAHAT